jgi:hypothetical protein
MNGQYPKFEEIFIPEAVGLALHHLDFIMAFAA